MSLQTILVKEYLTRKGVAFRESGKELIAHCLFNDCDSNSRANEAHLYFDAETGQYECKKCGEKGNLVTLAKHFGDGIQEIALNPIAPTKNPQNSTKFDAELVETCHLALPANIRQYLNARGISNAIVDAQKLGWGKFYGKWWITIPIPDIYGAFRFFKLRQDPNAGDDKITYPKGVEAQIYGWKTLQSEADRIVICEGELDRLALLSKGIPAITSTHGAMTFKKEWTEMVIGKCRKIYICYDNDEAGKKGTERVTKLLKNTGNELYIITLPQEVGEGGDITDYLVKLNGNPDDLFSKYAKEYPEKIDTSQFKPLSSQELVEILGLTIKQDEENKIVTFLCELSAYTENAQFNISYNAPSSTGKSYIPTEIARLLPEEDVLELAYCSPTAFFHDVGEWNKDMKGYVVDLSRKILIFLDQPHTQLLERLRPLLSHDKKEINVKITDKSQKFGLKTKNVLLKGYPSVIFCTAGLRIDEQEATRFLLLSPEVNHEKIRQGILESIKKEADAESYKSWLDENPERKLLKERIRAIKLEGIREIKIASHQKVVDRFLSENKVLKPRHQRDIKRLVSIIKSFALINLWWREKSGTTITANEDDIEQAFKIWDAISVSQELNLPPYIYNLYQEVILKAWNDKNSDSVGNFTETTGLLGLSRQELLQKHFEVYGRMLDTNQLRQQILPMLETAGLIVQEADQSDKRKMLIYPTALSTKSPDQKNSGNGGGMNPSEKNNSETSSGVSPDLGIF
ncbi:MAG: toprim domain-containing protein [Thermodesulfovibrionia bacterium]|nr:toprim domain-containing protein [Thermodesulfovibrionia bacterium]